MYQYRSLVQDRVAQCIGDLPLTLSNLAEAQRRYSNIILAALPPPEDGGRKVLDIGCGTGHLLTQLLARGYGADGLVPAPKLAQIVRPGGQVVIQVQAGGRAAYKGKAPAIKTGNSLLISSRFQPMPE